MYTHFCIFKNKHAYYISILLLLILWYGLELVYCSKNINKVKDYSWNVFLFFQIYDRRLKQYRSSLEDIDAALIQGINKRFKRQDGAEVIKIELDELNRQYISLIQWTKDRLREITRRLSEANVNIQVELKHYREIVCLVDKSKILFFLK